MLIVFFIIFLVMIVIGLIWSAIDDDWCFPFGSLAILVGGILELVVVSAMLGCAYDISQLQISDKKIAMYEMENNNIQNQISSIVDNYMTFEKDTYNQSIGNIDLSNTDIVVLTQLYPNLKSDEMVKTQIEIYQENNKKIKELKEEKLNNQVAKWWLYFGKIESEE